MMSEKMPEEIWADGHCMDGTDGYTRGGWICPARREAILEAYAEVPENIKYLRSTPVLERAVIGPHFEAWALIHDRKITEYEEECGIGDVYGVEYELCREILERELSPYLQEAFINPPKEAHTAIFRFSKFSHQEGQMSFPETGQWDFPPHWEMEVEVIGYMVEDKLILATIENEEKKVVILEEMEGVTDEIIETCIEEEEEVGK